MKKILGTAIVSAVVLTGALVFDSSTSEVSAQRYNCGDLWYRRNLIYAKAGYCFKTRRAIRTFGRRCYYPYGRLSRNDRRRVNVIIRAERRNYCR